MPRQNIIIVGAGPAGLTAAAELSENGQAVTLIEKDTQYVGGMARTVNYKGFRFDIGGHRFFSKSEEINTWWHRRLAADFIKVKRLSRIYYRGKFFDYPLKAFNALFGLGLWTSLLCVLSYAKALLFPQKPEKSFEDRVTNLFGRKLFSVFFKTYTEKVWGRPCDQISSDYAEQRIRGLSLSTAIWHAFVPQRKAGRKVVKTLIEEFDYPRLGPGMMWEKTRDDIIRSGGVVRIGEQAMEFTWQDSRVTSVTTRNRHGQLQVIAGDQFIVSMPLQESILAFDPPLAEACTAAAQRLQYRDFLTVALMIHREKMFPDNWIYIQHPTVRMGRIQNFNNWSAQMVPHPGVTCLGLEYFCFEGDAIWNMSDRDLIALGKRELEILGLASAADVFDGCVVRAEKAYPVYYPGYEGDVRIIREQVQRFTNFQVVGRNGMHKYNNQDHSMMTALVAARRVLGCEQDPWRVNTDAEYQEELS
jgi:protoporphyrinogen oxidase